MEFKKCSEIYSGKKLPALEPPEKKSSELDFWPIIYGLEWKCKDEGNNLNRPSAIITKHEFNIIRDFAGAYADNMRSVLISEKILNGVNELQRDKLIYHVIAKGAGIYETIIKNPEFIFEFVGQENGFYEFVTGEWH